MLKHNLDKISCYLLMLAESTYNIGTVRNVSYIKIYQLLLICTNSHFAFHELLFESNINVV